MDRGQERKVVVLGVIVGGMVFVAVAARWLTRRWHSVDSYHEREHRDPPVFDAGDYLGGGRI